jgi:hypothetical protein
MTRTAWTLACLLLFCSTRTHADDCRAPDPHIRSTDHEIVAAIADGTDHSATFRDLVERLNRSDVVVYVAFDPAPALGLAGRTAFISAAGGRRYLQIQIDRRYGGCRRLGILGHELRHAVEIADAAAVNSGASLAELYREIGFGGNQGHALRFESDAAVSAGRDVEREVLSSSSSAGRTR